MIERLLLLTCAGAAILAITLYLWRRFLLGQPPETWGAIGRLVVGR